MNTSDVVAEFIRRVNDQEDSLQVTEDLKEFVREVSFKILYDDHGHAEITSIYSVALNDETRDVQFVRVCDYSSESHAEHVTPVTKVITEYVLV